jgi:signal transduction histidine kinase
MNPSSCRPSPGTTLRLVVVGSTCTALALGLAVLVAVDLRTDRQAAVAQAASQAELLGHAGARDLRTRDAIAAHDLLATLRLQARVIGAALYDAQGRLFASYRADAAAQPPSALDAAPAGPDAATGHDRVVRRAIVDGGQAVGTVYLRVRDDVADRAARDAWLALAIVAAALAAAWPASARLPALATRVARELHDTDTDTDPAPADADRAAQQEVMRLNEDLERRVQLRTTQLEASNRELLAASREAESANRAKSEFLSNMSHELRTPLNAIIGFGQLLANDAMPPASPERNRGFVKHIVDAGNHLLTLINEVLNLAQVESGRLSISLEPVELREVLEECHALTRTASALRGIRLVFPLETALRVNADRTRLKQVLLNLLSNAVKYNRDHGAVIVECAPGDEGRVRLSIQDTGDGLAPDQLRQLFQPFNRLGRDAGGIEGSGIGLVLTRRLVELMGGTIGVHSSPGTGSTFWIDLRGAEPARPAAPVPEPRLPTPEEIIGDNGLRTSTILCVDDNRANLALLTEALSLRSDCVVLTAVDGQAGVEMARAHRPDVILMDNNMPVLSGRDAMRVLRADPSTAAIPVIAVSAAAMPDMVSSGLSQGYFRYLVKPYDLVDLTDAVDAAIDASRRAQPRQ